jgi:gas vesicle protein
MQVLSFEQFLLEGQATFRKKNLIEQIMLNVAESMEERSFVEMLIESNFFAEDYSLNEESLMDKMKRKYDEVVAVAKEKGKSALTDAQDKILAFGGKIQNVIKLVVEKVSKFLKETWDAARSAASSAVGKVKDKIETSVQEIKDKHLLSKEIDAFKTIAKGGVTWAINGFPKAVANAEEKAVKVDESELEEFLLEAALEISKNENFMSLFESEEEGIPFLSAIAHKLHKFPPFNLLHKIADKAGKVAKNALDKAAVFFSEVAGTPLIQFVVLPVLIGVVVEYNVKSTAVGLLHAIPGIGTVAHLIGTVALVLAVISVAEAAIKMSDDKEKTAKH